MITGYENMNEYTKKMFSLCLVIIMLTISYGNIINYTNNLEINKLYKYALQQNPGELNLNLNQIDVEESVYKIAHKMTNGLIIADEIWGILPMNKEYINKLNVIVEHTSLENKSVLLEVLDKWKKCDFSSIVQEHNYFWMLLNGTMGKAYGENKNAVKKAISDINKSR